MSDKNLTIVSKTDDLEQRILEVNAGLSKWLMSHDDYDHEKDMLRLIKFERQKESYLYHYEILKGENIYHIPHQRGNLNEKRTKLQE
jgi:hypothetical protein